VPALGFRYYPDQKAVTARITSTRRVTASDKKSWNAATACSRDQPDGGGLVVMRRW
jgi:hypothetical protein